MNTSSLTPARTLPSCMNAEFREAIWILDSDWITLLLQKEIQSKTASNWERGALISLWNISGKIHKNQLYFLQYISSHVPMKHIYALYLFNIQHWIKVIELKTISFIVPPDALHNKTSHKHNKEQSDFALTDVKLYQLV